MLKNLSFESLCPSGGFFTFHPSMIKKISNQIQSFIFFQLGSFQVTAQTIKFQFFISISMQTTQQQKKNIFHKKDAKKVFPGY